MRSRLTLLDQNNKKIYGGGNVKQGLVPSGTKFYGMRLKTNLNRARNSAGPGNPYDGVRFEQLKRINPSTRITGGTITTKGAYTYHTFSDPLASNSFKIAITNNPTSGFVLTRVIDYLLVGGGGGAGLANSNSGNAYSGGGGGGGVQEVLSLTMSAGTYAVTVGGGGAGGTDGAPDGATGGNSSFHSFTNATGGVGSLDAIGGLSTNGGTSGDADGNDGGDSLVLRGGGGGGGTAGTGGNAIVAGVQGGRGGRGGLFAAVTAADEWNPVLANSSIPAFGYGGGGAGEVEPGELPAGIPAGGGSTGGQGDENGFDATGWTVTDTSLFAGGGGGGAASNGASVLIHDGGSGADGIVIIRYLT